MPLVDDVIENSARARSAFGRVLASDIDARRFLKISFDALSSLRGGQEREREFLLFLKEKRERCTLCLEKI